MTAAFSHVSLVWKRRLSWRETFAIALLCLGCGPMVLPMMTRLEPEQQQKVDAGWDKLLSPVNRANHQELLDIMVGASVFQVGVDKLSFRSEKRYADGVVVMEITANRATPDEDRFVVTVLNHQGDVVRTEKYTRAEIEQTAKELTNSPIDANLPAEKQQSQREQYEQRRQKIKEFFPDENAADVPQETPRSGGRSEIRVTLRSSLRRDSPANRHANDSFFAIGRVFEPQHGKCRKAKIRGWFTPRRLCTLA